MHHNALVLAAASDGDVLRASSASDVREAPSHTALCMQQVRGREGEACGDSMSEGEGEACGDSRSEGERGRCVVTAGQRERGRRVVTAGQRERGGGGGGGGMCRGWCGSVRAMGCSSAWPAS